MAVHTMNDLRQMQALPLSIKIRMTEQRIREWVREYGEDGVYVSFSGGKDSTVLLDIVRNRCGYTRIPAVFVDTGLEYPEIRDFVKTFDNVEWLKPELTFKEVIQKYGYPFISKEVSEKVYYAQRYLDAIRQGADKRPSSYSVLEFLRVTDDSAKQKIKNGEISIEVLEQLFSVDSVASVKAKALFGNVIHKEKGVITDEKSKKYDFSRYKWLSLSPWKISNQCCDVMKKRPVKKYAKKTCRVPMTGQMAEESQLRKEHWIKNGCNGFQMKSPISNPMAFWTEQDVLRYIKENKLQICSVYGEIVADMPDECDGQISIEDLGLMPDNRKLKTTGCNRTGCMFCGFGCHLNNDQRFVLMKTTYPKQYEYIMKPKDQGGLGYKEIIDWINEHGNLHIQY